MSLKVNTEQLLRDFENIDRDAENELAHKLSNIDVLVDEEFTKRAPEIKAQIKSEIAEEIQSGVEKEYRGVKRLLAAYIYEAEDEPEEATQDTEDQEQAQDMEE